MDPMRDFVRDRTIDLQRLAADVHRERDLRHAEATTAIAPAPAIPTRLETVATPELACDPGECIPEAVARHAA